MSDQDLFNEKDNNQGEPDEQNGSDPTPSSTNPFDDKLKGIVNENGEPKYKDVESALDALQHSQQFIETLKREKQELESKYGETQAELEKRSSVEDVVNSLINKENPPRNDEGKTTPEHTGLDEDKVKQLVENMLNSKTQEQRQAENLSTVVSNLTEKYGEQAREVIRTRAKELNTTPTELENLAKQNPSMALSLLGGVEVTSEAPTKRTQTSPKGNQREDLGDPVRGMISGGATKEQVLNEWRAVRDSVYKKYDVEN